MLWIIIKKELSANLLSFRFVLIFLLCCTLILVSAYTMRGKYEERIGEYSTALKTHRQELEQAEGAQALSQAGTSGYKLDKPPTPLSVIVEGMEGAAGRFASINTVSTPTLEGGAGSDPLFAFFGTFDVMYIVRVVLSLVAILLTYDAISGERERGTLKLVLSNSLPRGTVLLAKCIGGYITLLLPFLVPMLIGLLILTTSGSIDFFGEDWVRLGLIMLASFLYVGIFLMLGLLVSSQTDRSTTSLMLLLFIWVVIVLAVPKVSMTIAGKLRDVPSVQEVQAEKDVAMAQIVKEANDNIMQYVAEFRRKAELKEIKDAEGALKRMQDEIAKMQQDLSVGITRKKGQIQAEYDAKKAAQFRLAANISRISPASVYTYAATDLARTGFDRQERFLRSARAYQVLFVQYYNEVLPKAMKQAMQRALGKTVEEVKFDLDKLPTLDFREASLSESWNSVWRDFLILFLLAVCFFMVAHVGFICSDVKSP